MAEMFDTSKEIPLTQKNVADIMKKWTEDKAETDAFIAELDKAENLTKIKKIAEEPLKLLAETVANSLDDITKTASITIGTEKYTFTPQECAQIFLAAGIICEDKKIAKNLSDYQQGKLLIDFYKGKQSFGPQMNALLESFKSSADLPKPRKTKSDSLLKTRALESKSALSETAVEFSWQFISREIIDDNGKKLTNVRICVPKNFDPATWQLNMFFCGWWVTVDKMEKEVFKTNKLKSWQAYCIVEWDYVDWTDVNRREIRYKKVRDNFDVFKNKVNDTLWWQPSKVCLIGHSAWGRVVNGIMATQKSDKRFTAISVDGMYWPTQASNIGKVYYVPGGPTAAYSKTVWWTAIPWDHYSIIPKALEDAGILYA